jgi:hypothetical protein
MAKIYFSANIDKDKGGFAWRSSAERTTDLESAFCLLKVIIVYKTEGSHSGLVRTLGKRVWSNPPGVRISYPPRAVLFIGRR